jgi:hypothetical protein
MKPDEMLYEVQRSKCVSRSGERCKFEVGVQEDATVFEKTECVSDAACGHDGICICNPNYYENFNGTCSPQRTFRGECLGDKECRSDLYFSCITGSCACNETNLVYSSSKGQCVGRAGRTLDGRADCTENAVMLDDTCVCSPDTDFYQDSLGYCQPKKLYTSECSGDEECKFKETYLSCVNGTCDCNPETLRYEEFTLAEKGTTVIDKVYSYDRNRGRYYWKDVCEEIQVPYAQCVGQPEKPCNSENRCVANSEYKWGTCTCEEGYARTSKEMRWN